MKRVVRWFDEAVADLAEHLGYVAERNPTAARAIAARIRQAGAALEDFSIGRPGRLDGTFERVLTDVPYTLVYAIRADGLGETVSILRVLHQAQRWPADDPDN